MLELMQVRLEAAELYSKRPIGDGGTLRK